jgi:5-methylcytosine-specific restriction endonuclease McrA
VKKAKCQNCQVWIHQLTTTNIAHILPKAIFKEVGDNIMNSMYLCNDCHSEFDSSWEKAVKMPVWSRALNRFNKIKHLVKNKYHPIIVKYFEIK